MVTADQQLSVSMTQWSAEQFMSAQCMASCVVGFNLRRSSQSHPCLVHPVVNTFALRTFHTHMKHFTGYIAWCQVIPMNTAKGKHYLNTISRQNRTFPKYQYMWSLLVSSIFTKRPRRYPIFIQYIQAIFT